MRPYWILTRPANLLTALSDVLAGMVIAGFAFDTGSAALLLLATLGLYGGGVVLNDYFDAELDAVERPERPIPSGQVSARAALVFGLSLLAVGVASAFFYTELSGWIAGSIALGAVVYDRFAKHSVVAGPLVMGLCRAGNLLLGVSVIPLSVVSFWSLGIVPLLYIAGITLISQGEVHGSRRVFMGMAAVAWLGVQTIQGYVAAEFGHLIWITPFLLVHAWFLYPPLWRAYRQPIGPMIGPAVKSGVLSLIVMNAAWCVAFGNPTLAILVLALLPISVRVARYFAVT